MLNTENLAERLITTGLASTETTIGCTEEEIRLLEERVGFPLPACYKGFLQVAGKCSGAFKLCGWSYPEVLGATDEAREMVLGWEKGRLELPEKAVALDLPTEAFLFIDARDGSDDPPVFLYYEGDGCFKQVSSSFWSFLEKEIEQAEAFRQRHLDSPIWQSNLEMAIRKARAIHSEEQFSAMRQNCKSHRGKMLLRLAGASLVLAVLALFFWFPALGSVPLGLAVLLFSERDLKEMRRGRMDLEGQQETKKAHTLAQIGLYISCIGLAFCIALFPSVTGLFLQELRYRMVTGHW
jgi:hypothetical protein